MVDPSTFIVLALLRAGHDVGAPVEQLRCLAENVYVEGAGQPPAARAAIAHTVLNRVADPRWPGTVCEVVRFARTVAEPDGSTRVAAHFPWTVEREAPVPRQQDLAGADPLESPWGVAVSDAVAAYFGDRPDPTAAAVAATPGLPETAAGATHYFDPAEHDYAWADHPRVIALDDLGRYRFFYEVPPGTPGWPD